eukprot:scaffold3290_cov259-Pinguiococcus_pyrenoidosus.AAC.1
MLWLGIHGHHLALLLREGHGPRPLRPPCCLQEVAPGRDLRCPRASFLVYAGPVVPFHGAEHRAKEDVAVDEVAHDDAGELLEVFVAQEPVEKGDDPRGSLRELREEIKGSLQSARPVWLATEHLTKQVLENPGGGHEPLHAGRGPAEEGLNAARQPELVDRARLLLLQDLGNFHHQPFRIGAIDVHGALLRIRDLIILPNGHRLGLGQNRPLRADVFAVSVAEGVYEPQELHPQGGLRIALTARSVDPVRLRIWLPRPFPRSLHWRIPGGARPLSAVRGTRDSA